MLSQATDQKASGNIEPLTRQQWILVCGVISAVSFIAFGCSLKGYFTADDAWHLQIVHRAFNGEPEMLWKLFFAPFAYRESLYVFYRPLADFLFSVDYLFWKANPFGWHLNNILSHIVCAILVFAFTRKLIDYLLFQPSETEDEKRILPDPQCAFMIPLLVSVAFAAYPCQAEPVCWIVCLVDLAAAAFQFGALICGIRFFQSGGKPWFAASIGFTILGLLTKEMCASIPFILLFVLLVKRTEIISGGKLQLRLLVREGIGALKSLWPYFAVLFAYLVVRSLALGSFLGGYIGNIGYTLNTSWAGRLLGLEYYWRLLHPINLEVFSKNSIEDLLLRGLYIVAALLVGLNYQLTKCMNLRVKVALILLLFLALVFVPCSQAWYVSSGLVGTRLTYSFGFLLFFILAFLVYPISSEKQMTPYVKPLRVASVSLFALFTVLFCHISIRNALAWTEASQHVNQIRADIAKLVADLPEEKKLVVVNLPSHIYGAVCFFTIDFLPGLLKTPLCESDITSRVISVDGGPINSGLLNLSRLRDLLAHRERYEFYVCETDTYKFHPVYYPTESELPPVEDRVIAIKEKGLFGEIDFFDSTNKNIAFTNQLKGDNIISYSLPIEPGIHPFDYDILELTITCNPRPKGLVKIFDDALYSIPGVKRPRFKRATTSKDQSALISWNTQSVSGVRAGSEDGPDLIAAGLFSRPVAFDIYAHAETAGELIYRIDMTEYKNWVNSGLVNELRLDMPSENHLCKLHAAVLKRGDYFIPKLSFKGQGAMNTCGLIEIEPEELFFKYDVSKIPKAKGAFVEVSRPYVEFCYMTGSFRDMEKSKTAQYTQLLPATSGDFHLPPYLVTRPSYYQVRVCAIDGDGNLLGSFSDPVTVATIKDLP